MRIISGSARGRRLISPTGDAIRPTSDKVKESIFNIIQFEIEGRRVLDLFAGSGQLGIEALSRGAREAVFVDQSSDACRLIKQNLKTAGFSASVVKSDFHDFLKPVLKPFHLVFIDPPYSKDIIPKSIQGLCSARALSDGAIVVVEASKKDILPQEEGGLRQVRLYNYGQTSIGVYRYRPEETNRPEGV